MVGEPQRGSLSQAEFRDLSSFAYNLAASEVEVHEEVYKYPLMSYIAEFGGSLGLFLGASFLSAWDLVEWGVKKSKREQGKIYNVK